MSINREDRIEVLICRLNGKNSISQTGGKMAMNERIGSRKRIRLLSGLMWMNLLAGLVLIAELQAAGRPGFNVVVGAGSADELLMYSEDRSSLIHGLVGSVAEETRLRNDLLAAGRTDRVSVSIWDGVAIAETDRQKSGPERLCPERPALPAN